MQLAMSAHGFVGHSLSADQLLFHGVMNQLCKVLTQLVKIILSLDRLMSMARQRYSKACNLF